MQPICWKMGCKSADSGCKTGKDAYIEKGEGLLRSGAKQYVDGGETIRRWRRNDGSIGPVPYVGQTESSPTFGHCFGNLGALLRDSSGIGI